jgi:hypothetical protein
MTWSVFLLLPCCLIAVCSFAFGLVDVISLFVSKRANEVSANMGCITGYGIIRRSLFSWDALMIIVHDRHMDHTERLTLCML